MFRLWYLLCGMVKKTSCLLDRKVKKKNQISEYQAPSPKRYNENWYVSNELIKNLLTQWNIEEENQKIYEV